MRSGGPAVPVPLLRRRGRHRSAGVSWSRGRYDEARTVQRVHRQQRARRDRAARSCATRSSILARCERSASASASLTPSSWPTSSPRPASQPAPSAVRPAGRPRARAGRPPRPSHQRAVRGRPVQRRLDLPDVDTVLFLRPTESATVFLAATGSRPARTRDKAVLTVLDFVGHQHKQFRFGHKAASADRRHAPRTRARDRDGASHSCRPAARSSWTSKPRRSCSTTSSRRSPTAGVRWSPSCASYGDHDLADLPRRVRRSSCPTFCGAAVTRGPGSAAKPDYRRASGSDAGGEAPQARTRLRPR